MDLSQSPLSTAAIVDIGAFACPVGCTTATLGLWRDLPPSGGDRCGAGRRRRLRARPARSRCHCVAGKRSVDRRRGRCTCAGAGSYDTARDAHRELACGALEPRALWARHGAPAPRREATTFGTPNI